MCQLYLTYILIKLGKKKFYAKYKKERKKKTETNLVSQGHRKQEGAGAFTDLPLHKVSSFSPQ